MKYILAILLFVSTTAIGDWRLNTLNLSYHYDRDTPHNEKHHGWGLEYEIDDGLWLGLTHLKNSFSQNSRLISLTSEHQAGDSDFYWGPVFAIADGYKIHVPGWEQDSTGKRRWGMATKGNEYRAIGGISLRYSALRITITPVVATVGLVFNLK